MKYLNMDHEENSLVKIYRLKRELLLSSDEYTNMKDEIKSILNVSKCPSSISVGLFYNLIDIHL